MAWLLTDTDFARAAAAVREGEVTPELYAFVWRLVYATTRPPRVAPALSPAGQWNEEAIEEVVQGWFEGRLLRGGLQRAFDRCANPAALSRYLEEALQNWLRSEARKRQRPRLLARARKLLDENPDYEIYRPATRWFDALWGRRGLINPEPHSGPVAELVRAAFSEDVTILRHAGDRADPVISNPDLIRVLHAVFAAAGALLTLRQVDEVLRLRFAHAYVEEVAVADIGEVAGETAAEIATVDAEVAAMRALARLSERQLDVLHGRIIRRETLEQLAAHHDCSRGTIDNEFRRAGEIIRDVISDDANRDDVLEKILEVAS